MRKCHVPFFIKPSICLEITEEHHEKPAKIGDWDSNWPLPKCEYDIATVQKNMDLKVGMQRQSRAEF
jgi:hypothetical protein